MTLSDYIKDCCKKKGITHLADVSRVMNVTLQALCNKYSRNKFTNEDLEAIAEALGATLEIRFIDKDTGQPI